jgi:hypothetical protein
MRSLVILGKGESCLKSNKKFIDSHDKVCIINGVVFSDKYKPFISTRANYQFINSSTDYYDIENFKLLGIEKIFFHGKKNQKFRPAPSHYHQVKMQYINPNLHSLFTEKFKFDPAGGIQALYYFSEIEVFEKISLVGFDFYQLNKQPYYFDVNEGGTQLKKSLIKKEYKGYLVNQPSGHNTEKSIKFCHLLMKEKTDIKFKIISNNEDFKNIKLDNVEIL